MRYYFLFLLVSFGLLSLTIIVDEENIQEPERNGVTNTEMVESFENSLYAKLQLSEYKIDSQVFLLCL